MQYDTSRKIGGKKEQEKSPDSVICGLSVDTNTKEKFRGLIFLISFLIISWFMLKLCFFFFFCCNLAKKTKIESLNLPDLSGKGTLSCRS